MFAIVQQKSCLLFKNRNHCSHREFVVLAVSGRSVNVSRKSYPKVARCRSGFCITVDVANFVGDVKLFLCVSY